MGQHKRAPFEQRKAEAVARGEVAKAVAHEEYERKRAARQAERSRGKLPALMLAALAIAPDMATMQRRER